MARRGGVVTMGFGVAFGLVLPMVEGPVDGLKPTWVQIRAMAERAEQLGFDTVWTADEIVWRNSEWPRPRGWWECLSMTGAVSACTTKVQVGTWVICVPRFRLTSAAPLCADSVDPVQACGRGPDRRGRELCYRPAVENWRQ